MKQKIMVGKSAFYLVLPIVRPIGDQNEALAGNAYTPGAAEHPISFALLAKFKQLCSDGSVISSSSDVHL